VLKAFHRIYHKNIKNRAEKPYCVFIPVGGRDALNPAMRVGLETRYPLQYQSLASFPVLETPWEVKPYFPEGKSKGFYRGIQNHSDVCHRYALEKELF